MISVRSTVRLQLNETFTLEDARARLPYFEAMGLSHLYLSPISSSRPGSTHGYDVIDHTRVNPELGGEAALVALATEARERGMGLIVDIVPNHMAAHELNAWWWDVLKNGRDSLYADWFDIDWHSPVRGLAGRVLAPFLGDPWQRCLRTGQIRLVYEATADAYQIMACGARYPLAPGSLPIMGKGQQDVLKAYEPDDPEGRQRLKILLDRQHYRLAWWRTAARVINWRRFFEINELIGVRVEEPKVFDAVHALILRLYAQGIIDGVRVDHVDGLAEPPDYCRSLRAALEQRRASRPPELRMQPPWVIVEKILASGESLDDTWGVDGTTGYDFMDQVSAVLHDGRGKHVLTEAWHRISGDPRTAPQHVVDARTQLLRRHFVAERNALLRSLAKSGLGDSVPWSQALFGRMVDGVLTTFPVYRSYTDANKAHGPKRDAIRRFQQLTPPLAAKSQEDTTFYRYGRLLSRNEVGSDPDVFSLSPTAFHDLSCQRVDSAPQGMLCTATHDHKRGEDVRARLAVLSELPDAWLQASERWLNWPGTDTSATGPAQLGERYMLYQTMVGAWPLDLGRDDGTHLRNFVRRLVQWQTKSLREAKSRSGWFSPDFWYEQIAEDFLISMVLEHQNHALVSDIGHFARYIAPAGALNSLAQIVLRMTVPGVPDLYQGTEWWDFSLVDPDNRLAVDFDARSAALHAQRQEGAAARVLRSATGISRDSEAMPLTLDEPTSDFGMIAGKLLATWRTGHIKQAMIASLLHLRREAPALFAQGDYLPLYAEGPRAENVLAFMRCWRDDCLIVVVSRLCAPLICGDVQDHGAYDDSDDDLRRPFVAPSFWEDTRLSLPGHLVGLMLRERFSGALLQADDRGGLALSAVLGSLPVAVLRSGAAASTD